MHAAADTAAAAATSEGTRAVSLRIPARPEYITLCRLALTGIALLRPVGDQLLGDLKLALTEAVSNSVRHAYGDHGEGHVEIRFVLEPERLTIEVVDDGDGFDPHEPPAVAGEELSEGGLGIAIIRTIADELEIASRPGERGSRLRFAKRLDA